MTSLSAQVRDRGYLPLTLSSHPVGSAQDLLIHVDPVTPGHTNEQVAELFSLKRQVQNLPVVHGERPMGLINRSLFHNMMAKPYYPELYSRQSCIAFMDKNPLVVETDTRIDTLMALAVQTGEKVFADGFIVVDGGCYRGVGQVLDLMRAMNELQARQHRQLVDSIDYASTIQSSLLKSSRQALNRSLPDRHWVLWQPRDTVGGDIFHCLTLEDGFLVSVFDCTGHGVPGAFMTLIAGAALERAIARHGHDDPALLLASMNRYIKQTLSQHDIAQRSQALPDNSDDGLEGVILRGYPSAGYVLHTGARMPLIHVRTEGEGQAEIIRSERCGVGYMATPSGQVWRNQRLEMAAGQRLYLASDGVIDQIGGPRRIAFGKKRLLQCLLDTRTLDMAGQKNAFMQCFIDYRGRQAPRDDLTLLALQWPDE
ncbi:SpoIIE family protein phosphatase [Ectothiorhodospira lacustris]|uniref:SpoIIE family protein phosphatase n=1 Tax=Ectothiorhodospira lacustris TaxID=2899127 RepID=UPI001EE91407|nr:SpoIIE family protein phosphatase [Ectothiorhodospira lacustris]MCG5501997.1 SpoIIE family protein phosphatase [Ectothiorhodospira lacustris]MCG5509520.1 SpoIIE family protein phosphatase [Ectothiorhodospira lacustris]MCG5521685.1 SpoIIE family protein phosphatase [Ectothiorhodospira lacustris]